MAEEDKTIAAEALTTEHLYYEDTELYSSTGRVIGQWETEMNGEKRVCLVLDRTIMHPQGGVYSGCGRLYVMT